MNVTETQLTELEALAAEATPEEPEIVFDEDEVDDGSVIAVATPKHEDAEFYETARLLVPALVAEVRASRASPPQTAGRCSVCGQDVALVLGFHLNRGEECHGSECAPAAGSSAPLPETRARWMPGGAFCDCGKVEFMVPGPACVRVEERGTDPTQHTPVECRGSTAEERRNLAPETVCRCGHHHNAGSDGEDCGCAHEECDCWTWAAPEGHEDGPEARLRAFAEKYRAQQLTCSFMAGTDVDRSMPWALEWRRRYDDCDSDFRNVSGTSLADVVRQAEEWEAENDRREPEHAGLSSRSGGGNTSKGE